MTPINRVYPEDIYCIIRVTSPVNIFQQDESIVLDWLRRLVRVPVEFQVIDSDFNETSGDYYAQLSITGQPYNVVHALIAVMRTDLLFVTPCTPAEIDHQSAEALIPYLESGEWAHTIISGPNPTYFTTDPAPEPRAAAAALKYLLNELDRIRNGIAAKIEQVEASVAAKGLKNQHFSGALIGLEMAKDIVDGKNDSAKD